VVVELPRGKPVAGQFPAVVGWHGLRLRNWVGFAQACPDVLGFCDFKV